MRVTQCQVNTATPNELTFTRDFLEWAKDDNWLDGISVATQGPLSHSLKTKRDLSKIGFSSQTMIVLYGMLKDRIQTGYARFRRIRVLCWYWDNGDQIVFPINSKNQVYLGNDGLEWIEFWPFLKPIGYGRYLCDLPVHKPSNSIRRYGDEFQLLICGQSHFGHFITNQLISLREDLHGHHSFGNYSSIIHPPDYEGLHKQLLAQYAGIKSDSWNTLPKINGVHEIRDCIVPCIDEHTFGLMNGKGAIELGQNHRNVTKGKRVYVTRGLAGQSDRLINYSRFVDDLKDLGFIVCNPASLSFESKLDLLGDAEVILSDSGSCWLNGLLFSNINTKIVNMFPSSLLKSLDKFAVGQLSMNLGLFVGKTMYPLEVYNNYDQSSGNTWYSLCIPPDQRQILLAIQGDI